MTDNIKKLILVVSNSSNYSILLTSEFKERHNELLSLLELFSELRHKADKELITLSFDYKKLEAISEYNSEIDSSYSSDEDILTISHKILLSKIKSNVKNGIEKKIRQFDAIKKTHQDISKKLEDQLNEIDSISIDKLVDYIKTDFNINKIIENIRFPIKKESFNEKNKKKNKGQDFDLIQKVIKDYSNLFDKYLSKDKISTSKLEKGNQSDITFDDSNTEYDIDFEEENDFSDIIRIAKSGKRLEAVKLMKDKTGWELKECKDWVDSII